MPALSSSRSFALIIAFAGLASSRAAAQDGHSDRFGLGPVIIAGWFGSYSGAFAGGEGFVRIARDSFWSVRLDGSYLVSLATADKVNVVQGGGQNVDPGALGRVGILMASVMLGPSPPNGLRPIYGLVGVGGAATRYGELAHISAGQSEAGPSFTILELGLGSEFRALGNNRIELRAFRTAPSPPSGNPSVLGAIGTSLTIGVVW
jgi:hypothetical protein